MGVGFRGGREADGAALAGGCRGGIPPRSLCTLTFVCGVLDGGGRELDEPKDFVGFIMRKDMNKRSYCWSQEHSGKTLQDDVSLL